MALLASSACTAQSDGPPPNPSPMPGPPTGQMVNAQSTNRLIWTAVHQINRRKYADAAANLARVLDVSPDNQYAWFNLGVIAQYRNQTAKAMKDYERALLADPRFTSPMYNKAILIENADPDTAMALYTKIVAINPQ